MFLLAFWTWPCTTVSNIPFINVALIYSAQFFVNEKGVRSGSSRNKLQHFCFHFHVCQPVITSLLYGSPNVVNWYSPYLFGCTPISFLTRTAIINKIKPINFRPTVKQTPTKFYKKLSKSSIKFTVATCDQERVDSAQPRSNVWTFLCSGI